MSISQAIINQLRPADDDGHGPIIRVGADRQSEAVSRLLAAGTPVDRDHARRFIEYANAHRIDLDGLWSRLDAQGRIAMTALTVPSPGRTAMVFASHPTGAGHVQSLAGLIGYATRQLAQRQVNLAQVLLDPSELLEREVFHAAGYIDLATLSYLERPVRTSMTHRLTPPDWPKGIAATPYDPSMKRELIDVLTASYEDTLDCPGLRGHRDSADILDGHLATGVFDARLWTILRNEGKAIGALLMNASADHQSIELVYIGLVKSMRAQSLGRRLLRYGLRQLANRTERMINLAVDEANAPAARLYAQEGFRLALRRRALIHPL